MTGINARHRDGLQLFHGTGFMSHDFGTDKYNKLTYGTRKNLELILKDGLLPFPDPLNHNFSSSISLTMDIKYALLYALCYSEKGTSHLYGVNRLREWTRILSSILIDAKPFSREKYKKSRGQKRERVGLNDLSRWTCSFSNEYADLFMGGFRGMILGESDIKGNFPVLLGFSQLKDVRVMKGWNEVRIEQSVPPQEIKAIFVPEIRMNSIARTTNIPVYPLESLF